MFLSCFFPLSYLAHTNAAEDEENKHIGVEESEVKAGLSDHKCLSPLETFSPEHVGKLYQLACKYIKSQNPDNDTILCKNNTIQCSIVYLPVCECLKYFNLQKSLLSFLLFFFFF